jgi:deoxyribose-phosphate aldolase
LTWSYIDTQEQKDAVARDINRWFTAHAAGALVKVIIEAALLTDEEKTIACQLSRDAGVDFVKTSTGFGPSGATVHDVALMRQVVGPTMGIKAAGGIRTLQDADDLIAVGATRLGASASVKISEAKPASGRNRHAGTAQATETYCLARLSGEAHACEDPADCRGVAASDF